METCSMDVDVGLPFYNKSKMEAQLEELTSAAFAVQLEVLRSIRNSVIGNAGRKAEFGALGLCETLISLIERGFHRLQLSGETTESVDHLGNEDVDILTAVCAEAVVVLGSLARMGNIAAHLVDSGGVSLLCKGLFIPHDKTVMCCLRALENVCESMDVHRRAAVERILCEQENVLQRLVSFLDYDEHAESAAIVLSMTLVQKEIIQTLVELDLVDKLALLLQRPRKSVRLAGMRCCVQLYESLLQVQCSGSVIKSLIETAQVSEVVIERLYGRSSMLSQLLLPLMAWTEETAVQLGACQVFTYMYLAGLLQNQSVSRNLQLRVFPTLVHLTKEDKPLQQATTAVFLLSLLLHDNVPLQQVGIYCDQLSAHLVQRLLASRKNSASTHCVAQQEEHVFQQCCLNALAEICSTVERLRKHVVTPTLVEECVSVCGNSSPMELRLAAFNFLLAMSRSVELLRSRLAESEAWKPVLEVLRTCGSDMSAYQNGLLANAVSVSCNMLAEFYPKKSELLSGEVVQLLVNIVHNCMKHYRNEAAEADKPSLGVVCDGIIAVANAVGGQGQGKKLELLHLLSEDLLECLSTRLPVTVRCAAFLCLRNLLSRTANEMESGGEQSSQVASQLLHVNLLSAFAENIIPAEALPTSEGSLSSVNEDLVLSVLGTATNYCGSLASCSLVVQHQAFIQCLHLCINSFDYPFVQLAAVECVSTVMRAGPHVEVESILNASGIQHALKKIEVRGGAYVNLLHAVKVALELFS